MAAPVKSISPLDLLQQMFNDVLVQTGKALKAANRDGKGSTGHSSPAASAKIAQSVDIFNGALDDLESDITRSKAAILRDLQLLQAKRQPPPPQQITPERQIPIQETKHVAPPAPMVIDVDPPPRVTPVPLPLIPPQSSPRQVKAETNPSAPVAPFPNMGFDLTGSPEVTPVPIPTPSMATASTKVPTPTPAKMPTPTPAKIPTPIPAKMPTPTPAKIPTPTPAKMPTPIPAKMPTPTTAKIPTPAPAKVPTPTPAKAPTPVMEHKAVNRPTPSPPKKETKVPVPQVPRSGSTTIQQPTPASVPPVAPIVTAKVANLATSVTSPPNQTLPAQTTESLFTNMGFTVALPQEEPQSQVETQAAATVSQTQASLPVSIPEAIDLTDDSTEMGGLTLESFGISSVPGAEIANMSLNFTSGGDESNVDAKIDGLFDLDSTNPDAMEIDYGLDGVGDNFESMFFNGAQDDPMDTGEFNDAFFGI